VHDRVGRKRNGQEVVTCSLLQGASCCKSTDLGERLLKVARMDWIHIPKILAIAAAIIVCVGALIFATMSWLLNHPKD
jgi:hypothetical protein